MMMVTAMSIARGIVQEAVEVDEGGHEHVDADPNPDPRIEGQG